VTSPSTTSTRTSQSAARTRRDADSAADGDRTEAPADGGREEARTSNGVRADHLTFDAHRDLLTELRAQEQEQARRQLSAAAESSEDAVAGLVRGVVTIVRGVLPTALTRPEEVIETTYALADQGLRVMRRLALAVTGGVRDVIV
jgi:hypothetical protein